MIRTFGWILLVTSIHTVAAQEAYNKARVALGARDTAAAISAFLEAVKAGQKTSESNHYLGAIALGRGKVDEAVGYLQASLKSNDENVDAFRLLGEALLLKKDTSKAMASFRQAVKYGKKNPAVLAAYGKALLSVDSIDAAIRTLTEAELYAPENASVEASLGDAYQKQNVMVLAIVKYQKAAELEPKNIQWHFKLAKAYAKNRQYTEAVKEFDSIIAIDSLYAEPYLEKARILVAAKRHQQAVPVGKKLVQLQPKLKDGWILYARALFGAEDFVECVKVSRQTLQLDSSSVDVWRALAHSLVETKDYAASIGAFDALKRRATFNPQDMMKLGLALQQLKRDDEALQLLLTAVAADSANCDPYFALGSIYMNKRDYANGAIMFEKKITCDPKSLSAYINAAACHMQVGNLARARELLLLAIDLKSDFLLARLWLGRSYAMMDSLEMSGRQYDEVLKLIGTQTDKFRREAGEANGQRGQNYFLTKQYERAIEYLKRAIGLGYESASIELTLGQALILARGDNAEENKKKIEDAVKHFRRCVELEAGNAQGHLWLAQSLVFSRVEGDNAGNKKLTEEACSEYKKVVRLDPKNTDAAKGMERIGCN